MQKNVLTFQEALGQLLGGDRRKPIADEQYNTERNGIRRKPLKLKRKGFGIAN